MASQINVPRSIAVASSGEVKRMAARLHRDGWSVGDMAVNYPGGYPWVVSWQRDGRWVVAEGRTQEEA